VKKKKKGKKKERHHLLEVVQRNLPSRTQHSQSHHVAYSQSLNQSFPISGDSKCRFKDR
jgi:hypothetical protein